MSASTVKVVNASVPSVSLEARPLTENPKPHQFRDAECTQALDPNKTYSENGLKGKTKKSKFFFSQTHQN
jgi:hypothetical protein